MTISQADAMRELHAYAMEEMRNRGLEDAARIIERRYQSYTHVQHRDQMELEFLAAAIRLAKRAPSKQLSDWWGNNAGEPVGPSTLAADALPSDSESPRGEPAPQSAVNQ